MEDMNLNETVEEGTEAPESVDYNGIAVDVFNIACVAREVANQIQELDNGTVKGKAEFRKATVEARRALKPLLSDIKKARRDILVWKAYKVDEIPGARKSKTKEQLMEEAQKLMDRAQSMN
jgi:predicted phage gp36 major capsid-like protein